MSNSGRADAEKAYEQTRLALYKQFYPPSTWDSPSREPDAMHAIRLSNGGSLRIWVFYSRPESGGWLDVDGVDADEILRELEER